MVSERKKKCSCGDRTYVMYNVELVVAESVLVLTRLLQVPSEERSKSVIALVKLLDQIHIPRARANILWLVGQYAQVLPKVGPDVLRQAIKGFSKEENLTKLQILTLSAKLICLNPEHPTLVLLNQYLLGLARYDVNYDVRDRARFLRALTILNGEDKPGLTALKQHLPDILLSNKQSPIIQSGAQSKLYRYNSNILNCTRCFRIYGGIPFTLGTSTPAWI